MLYMYMASMNLTKKTINGKFAYIHVPELVSQRIVSMLWSRESATVRAKRLDLYITC